MTDILEIRFYIASAIVFVGMLIIPFTFFFYMARKYGNKKAPWWVLPVIAVYLYIFFNYSRDMIPEKYDIVPVKVYQCEWVEKYEPKYPRIDK